MRQGESRTLEFKSEFPSDSSKWVKTIVAFANGAGGKLLIGMSNARAVLGLAKGTDCKKPS
ncbi:MAG: ATP-binding protein, partial [Fibrobacteraceae bacterium]|nr:ATP-binding protein [Fibrobacteraceae bacterium]